MGTRLGWRELNWSAAQLGLGWSSHMGTRGQLSVGSLTLPTENRGQLSVGSLTLPTENRGQLSVGSLTLPTGRRRTAPVIL